MILTCSRRLCSTGLLPGIRPLTVDMPTLAKIFTGKIRHWRDPEMLRLNPDTAQYLPDANITVSSQIPRDSTTRCCILQST